MKYSVDTIEKILYTYLPKEEGYPETVLKAMNYAFLAGGKRIRPMIMKMCFDMFGRNESAVVEPFMAAIEMIHTYSLIHDDLPALDNDELRRGKPTVHVAFGEDMAILAGDGLLNYAYETACKAFRICPGDIRVEKAMTILASRPGIYGMIGGQVLDVELTGKSLDENQLEYIYLNKTAALLACAMTIGAVLGGANEDDVSAIEKAAIAVGMAFQVQDDILDLVGDEQTLGKPIQSDERNQKTTYVTLHGMDESRQYVKAQSELAISLIDKLIVDNKDAKEQLMNLINSLIDRDR